MRGHVLTLDQGKLNIGNETEGLRVMVMVIVVMVVETVMMVMMGVGVMMVTVILMMNNSVTTDAPEDGDKE